MGADIFQTRAKGGNAKAAFEAAVLQARYDKGHSGYTGTIAEKDQFVMIAVPEGIEPTVYASKLIDDSDPRIDDKWGAAGCIKLGDDEYLFFGWASS